MNNLFKALNQWANRLVIRILILTGVPKEQTDRLLTAMNERNTALNEADRKLKGKYVWLKYLIMTLIIIGIVYITFKIKKLRK